MLIHMHAHTSVAHFLFTTWRKGTKERRSREQLEEFFDTSGFFCISQAPFVPCASRREDLEGQLKLKLKNNGEDPWASSLVRVLIHLYHFPMAELTHFPDSHRGTRCFPNVILPFFFLFFVPFEILGLNFDCPFSEVHTTKRYKVLLLVTLDEPPPLLQFGSILSIAHA